MNVRRTIVSILGMLALVTGCDRLRPAPEPSAPAAEPAAVAPEPAPVTQPPPLPAPDAVPEPLTMRFVSPNIGPANGGNEVVIDGRGFAAYPHVSFGDAQAWIRSVTPTEIRLTVPRSRAPARRRRDVDGRRPGGEPAGRLGSSGEPNPGQRLLLRRRGRRAVRRAAGRGAPPHRQVPHRRPHLRPPRHLHRRRPPPPGPTLVARFTFIESTDSADCPAPSTSVRFTDRSTGGVTGWLWDFGDGETSDEQHPEHCYGVAGMRSVSLTVSGGGSSASASEIVITGM